MQTRAAAAHSLEPTDGPLPKELQLAFRNRGMPLEAMARDLTPTGLHYIVTHWDIVVDHLSWRLAIGGCVRTPLELTLRRSVLDRVARSLSRLSAPATDVAG